MQIDELQQKKNSSFVVGLEPTEPWGAGVAFGDQSRPTIWKRNKVRVREVT